MTDTVVERLGAKHNLHMAEAGPVAMLDDPGPSQARWWLNAIADEGRRRFNHGSGTAQDVWDWLQEQAR